MPNCELRNAVNRSFRFRVHFATNNNKQGAWNVHYVVECMYAQGVGFRQVGLGLALGLWQKQRLELLYNFEFLLQIDTLVLRVELLLGGQLGTHFSSCQWQIQATRSVHCIDWRHTIIVDIRTCAVCIAAAGCGGCSGCGGATAAAVDVAIVVKVGYGFRWWWRRRYVVVIIITFSQWQ